MNDLMVGQTAMVADMGITGNPMLGSYMQRLNKFMAASMKSNGCGRREKNPTMEKQMTCNNIAQLQQAANAEIPQRACMAEQETYQNRSPMCPAQQGISSASGSSSGMPSWNSGGGSSGFGNTGTSLIGFTPQAAGNSNGQFQPR